MTIQNILQLSCLTVSIVGLTACGTSDNKKTTQKEKTAAQKTQTKGKTSQSLPIQSGTYFANLPSCKGCPKVRVNIYLGNDYSYDKSEEVKPNITFETGKWAVRNGLIKLIPDANSKGQSTIRFFSYKNNKLTLVQPNGKAYTGNQTSYQFKLK